MPLASERTQDLSDGGPDPSAELLFDMKRAQERQSVWSKLLKSVFKHDIGKITANADLQTCDDAINVK